MIRRFKTPFYALSFAVFLAGAGPVLALDSPALNLARQLNEAFIEVADKVAPTVVVIEVTEKAAASTNEGSWWDLLPPDERPRHRNHRRSSRPLMGEGSGVVVSEDGYILTNNHVVENADKITVRFKDGRSFDGEVKGTDPASDIAVIKIKAHGLAPAKLGDSEKTRVGEFVLAIGAPFALSYSVTFGHVSAKGRSFEQETPGYADQDFIQTDASINPGNSGGPLVNLYGEVIAINTMIYDMNTGIGFAVPINLARRVKDHLIAEGKFTRSWIGIGFKELKDYLPFKNLDPSLSTAADGGIVVTMLQAGGPASRSALRTGDVIISVGGKTVQTGRELRDCIAPEKAGQVLTLNVVRGRERLAIQVKTEAMPSEEALDGGGSQPSVDKMEMPGFGLTVQPLPREAARQYGVEPGSGVIVTMVESDSAAGTEGIQPGDVITKLNRQPVTSLKQFRQALKMADMRKGVVVDLISNGSSRMVILKGGE